MLHVLLLEGHIHVHVILFSNIQKPTETLSLMCEQVAIMCWLHNKALLTWMELHTKHCSVKDKDVSLNVK